MFNAYNFLTLNGFIKANKKFSNLGNFFFNNILMLYELI